jgi:hypothetical protein
MAQKLPFDVLDFCSTFYQEKVEKKESLEVELLMLNLIWNKLISK